MLLKREDIQNRQGYCLEEDGKEQLAQPLGYFTQIWAVGINLWGLLNGRFLKATVYFLAGRR